MSTINLDNIQNIYIIGIEGAGTSALACILKSQGKNVIGSDEGDHFYYDVLKKKDIKVFHRFGKENLKQSPSKDKKIDLIIYSTSVTPEQNEELKYAMEEVSKARLLEGARVPRSLGEVGKQPKSVAFSERVEIMSYPQALAMIFNGSEFGIAVCGTHGKTTTTAMLATAMKAAGADPTALVGSKVPGWEGGALISSGNKDNKDCPAIQPSEGWVPSPRRAGLCKDYFIIEADEYQNKLQHYNPQAVILTSVDYDHPDFFKTVDEYKQVFKDFVSRIPEDGFLVAYAGDEDVVEVTKEARCEVIFYDIENDYKLNLILSGQHNLLNTTAALKVVEKLELDTEKAKTALENFQGTARRFEIKGVFPIAISETNLSDLATTPSKKTHKCGALVSFFRQVVDKSGWFGQKLEIGKTPQQGEYNEAIIIDDYAHHPTEVKAALQATKEKYPTKNIKCIFHPHTFTRTETLLNDFAKSFNDADEIYLLDIFGSAREKQGGVTSDNLVEKIKLQEQDKTVKNLHTIPEATKYFQQNLQPNDILITMGAGDVYLVGENLLKEKE